MDGDVAYGHEEPINGPEDERVDMDNREKEPEKEEDQMDTDEVKKISAAAIIEDQNLTGERLES